LDLLEIGFAGEMSSAGRNMRAQCKFAGQTLVCNKSGANWRRWARTESRDGYFR
jgi:hypothetical protein